jgi:hypothetical protein
VAAITATKTDFDQGKDPIMTISKTTIRRLRGVGTAALWLGGWCAVFVGAAWLGSGHVITGLHTVVIVFSVVFFATWIGCRLVVFVDQVRQDAAMREWELAKTRRLQVVPDPDTSRAARGGDAVDGTPTGPVAA